MSTRTLPDGDPRAFSCQVQGGIGDAAAGAAPDRIPLLVGSALPVPGTGSIRITGWDAIVSDSDVCTVSSL